MTPLGNKNSSRNLFLVAGVSGIVGTCCYIIAITVRMNDSLGYAVAMAWPVLSIIFVYGLVRFIALTDDGLSNQLAGVFAYLAFALVAAMISIQSAIELGSDTSIANSSQNQQEFYGMMKRFVRLVEMGLDAAGGFVHRNITDVPRCCDQAALRFWPLVECSGRPACDTSDCS